MAWAEINEMNEISPSGNALTFPSISLETVSLANASPMRPESLWEGAKEKFGYRGHQSRQSTTPNFFFFNWKNSGNS